MHAEDQLLRGDPHIRAPNCAMPRSILELQEALAPRLQPREAASLLLSFKEVPPLQADLSSRVPPGRGVQAWLAYLFSQ